MKNSYCILIFLLHALFLFGQEQNSIGKIDSIRCVIVKIDSIGNFYIIDVLSNENKYKIVSRKVHSDCYNLHEGEIYQLCLYPTIPDIASHHEHNIGLDTYVEIDWGTNLYVAQELCGLCYQTDTVKLKKCKRLISQQCELEAAMSTVYFFYKTKKDNHTTFIDFYKKQMDNAMSFTLSGTNIIPIYVSPKNADIKYQLFSDTMCQKVFNGKVLYEYKKYYLIQGYYDPDIEVEFLGWIEKRHLHCKQH
ncbi:hypothetical protein EOM86_05025 [Candidatus Nomurabacteria bacterium]|nr:hypothetical protein [Candidatus Nomurabacteria bacterium]